MRKFGRESSHRMAMLRNLCVSLIENNYLVTTISKAKDLKRVFDKLVTRAKKGNTLHNRRIIISKLNSNKQTVLNRIFEIADYLKERQGGYTSLLKCGIRKSDSSQMARIEILSS